MPLTWFPIIGSGLLGFATEVVQAAASAVMGSILVLGNMYFDTALVTTPTIYRNTTAAIALSQSGVELKSNGLTAAYAWTTACTNTGGLTKYPTCYVRNPFGSTGALVNVALECGGTNKALSMSGGFVTSTTAAVTSAFPTLSTISVGSGAFNAFNVRATSGSVLKWKPDQAIKFQTVTAMPAGGIDCVVHTEAYDKYGR